MKSNDKIPWQPYYFIINKKKYRCIKLNEFLINNILDILNLLKKNVDLKRYTDFNTSITDIINSCLQSDLSLVIQDYDNNTISAFILAISYENISNDITNKNMFTFCDKHVLDLYDGINKRSFFSLNKSLKVNIIMQCTHPDYQKKGFGYILRNQFIKRCKELEYSIINFHTNNLYMIKIWITNSKFKIIKNYKIEKSENDLISLINGNIDFFF